MHIGRALLGWSLLERGRFESNKIILEGGGVVTAITHMARLVCTFQ